MAARTSVRGHLGDHEPLGGERPVVHLRHGERVARARYSSRHGVPEPRGDKEPAPSPRKALSSEGDPRPEAKDPSRHRGDGGLVSRNGSHGHGTGGSHCETKTPPGRASRGLGQGPALLNLYAPQYFWGRFCFADFVYK